MKKTAVSKATLGRLPQYLAFLRQLPPNAFPHISATAIAHHLCLGDVQVRKDLASVSGAGKPRLGYNTAALIGQIEDVLGCHKATKAVLVGAGKLGRALLQFDEFQKYGVTILAAFDSNEQILSLAGKTEILPMKAFETFCKAQNVQIGIITVGEGSAQDVCDRMVKSGITAIWNFAPCKLTVPPGVMLQNENLALSLAKLNYQLCHSDKEEPT